MAAKREVLYGVRMVRVAALEPNGDIPDNPVWHVIDAPQQVQTSLQVSTGQTQELRGGDRLITVVREPDKVFGADITLQDAMFDEEALLVINGGKIDDDGEYVPPELDEEPPAFMMEVYQAIYGEGSQNVGDAIGFKRTTFWNCRGSIQNLNQQDRNFSATVFSIKAEDNKVAGKRYFSWKTMSALPTT